MQHTQIRQQTQQFNQKPVQPPQYYSQPTPPLRSNQNYVSRSIPRPGALSREIKKIKPREEGHKKEILLLFVLLFLVGLLVLTIFFRQTILGWFA